MKICVVTPRFAIAGVPLAQIRFARALAQIGHEVDLVVGFVDPLHKLPQVKTVNVVQWQESHVRGMFLPFRKYLQETKPDVVFSAEDHLNAIVLLAAIVAGSKAKISGSSRVTPLDTYSSKLFTKRWILKHLNSRQRMMEPVDHDWLLQKGGPVVVAAGRLATWKGFEDLIRAIKFIPSQRRVRLMILGDGPLRFELEALIIELGLKEVVRLLGYVENPLKYFARADVFVLSSHVEGLPNVLVEAMMCGCTPVATDCPTGPREVLRNGKYGYLVPVRDPVAMAIGIEQALDHPIPKALLAEAIQPFKEDAVIHRHFEILGLTDS